MNIKTNLLEEYVNFAESTKKQKNYFKIILILFASIIALFFLFSLNIKKNNTHSLDQKQKTGDLNADLLMRQYKLSEMANLMAIKSINPKLNNLKSPNYWNYHLLRCNDIEKNNYAFTL